MLAALAVIALVPAGAARAATLPPEAAALLTKVRETYGALQRFDLAGASHIDINGANFNNKVDVRMRFSADRPKRFRNEVQNPNFPSRYVCDGDSVWAWLPMVRQYVAWPIASARIMAEIDPGLAQSMNPLLDFERLGTRARAARVLGTDTLRLEDRVAQVTRLEVEDEPDTSRKDVSVWPRVYWIEASTGLVLRDSLRADVIHAQLGQLTTVQVTRYARATLGGALDDSLFRFTPPPGANRGEAPQPPAALQLRGRPAPDFTLARYGAVAAKGRRAPAPVKLSALKGKVVLLDFWATWCGPCRRWMPIVEKVKNDLAGRGLEVFAINERETDDKIAKYLKETGVKVPVLLDRDGAVGLNYQASSIPLTVIVGRDGLVAKVMVGLHDEAQLREALRSAGLD